MCEILDIANVSVNFGGVRALDNVSCSVGKGELCGLVGPNGAGKTTLFNCITRQYDVDSGSITFEGQEVVRKRKSDVVRIGIARTFQNIGLYPDMTVLENAMLGAAHRRTDSLFSGLYQPRHARREEVRAAEFSENLLRELGLGSVAHRRAGDLPYGSLKRLEVVRALVASPKLLLLDEPAAGLSRGEVDEFATLLKLVQQKFGITVLLVEHNMRLVMDVCERIVVLHLGRVLAIGTPEMVRNDPQVVGAYLGGD